MHREYKTIVEVAGPLMLVEQGEGVKYEEWPRSDARWRIRARPGAGSKRDKALVQIFEGSTGLDLTSTRVRFGQGLVPASSPIAGGVQRFWAAAG